MVEGESSESASTFVDNGLATNRPVLVDVEIENGELTVV